MKKFTKLALAASVALSANAMAMQAMDDSTLSATTGQDGISIGIGISRIEIEKLYVHDNDGYTGAGGTGEAGAIYIKGTDVANGTANTNGTHSTTTHGVVIGANYDNGGAYLLASKNLADLVIDSDAGTAATGGAFINIAAEVSGLDINIGEIGVVASGEQGVGDNEDTIRRGGTGTENAILSGLSLKTGPMSANIQVGAAPQGAMIKLNATMVGGLTINDLGILDNSSKKDTPAGADVRKAGEIFIKSIQLADAEDTDLKLNQSISVMGSELAGTTPNKGYIRIVSTSGAHDTYVKGIHLGSYDRAANAVQTTSIGDVEVQGLQTYYSPDLGQYNQGAIIKIAGH